MKAVGLHKNIPGVHPNLQVVHISTYAQVGLTLIGA